MSDAGLHWASIAQLRGLLGGGQTSSVELTGQLLARIERHDGAIASFAHVAHDALEQARASDARRRAGAARPLEGIPVALKDNFLTASTIQDP